MTTSVVPRPYASLTPNPFIPSRILMTAGPSVRLPGLEANMLDIVFLCVGGGTFVLLALYARALEKL